MRLRKTVLMVEKRIHQKLKKKQQIGIEDFFSLIKSFVGSRDGISALKGCAVLSYLQQDLYKGHGNTFRSNIE